MFVLPICNPYERRKDPQKVRAALIDAAAALIAEQGLARLTVDAVARKAGVTKGGLFHHFASKQDLVDGVLDAMLAVADAAIDVEIAQDPEPHGAFTRAYLRGNLSDRRLNADTSARSLCLAALADPALQDRWIKWVRARLVRHAATDDTAGCALVRLAADGIWIRSLHEGDPPEPLRAETLDALFALTRPSSTPDATPGRSS